ncbi:hypothetical protein BD324DRAFT_681645 [Kockovaella imperatae]|uniref:Sodium/calcium exchanger membrane region domain-containing protein n=1 Tax=Kockovaella imperatae TaxID=4999 RepID=A0A1Y1UIH1_9TREE|nr:hypothetical protein BD324DRAFT_681645 [Kockovaella imperatae]ORX36895.1 hypothetical protein BD324DRAFT_681645 [Kockovaella imperatae]
MVNGEVVAYNFASLICALFVLEKGADIFIDHTAIVALRTGIPKSAIALLTAGAEWEELAVVVISLARNRSSLAIGNVVGSAIANILGAFSLGLIFYRNPSGNPVLFERSSVVYSVALLGLTAIASALLAFGGHVQFKAAGGAFIALFVVYLSSISWLIFKGVTKAPEELSDSDSDSDDGSSDTTSENGVNEERQTRSRRGDLRPPSQNTGSRFHEELDVAPLTVGQATTVVEASTSKGINPPIPNSSETAEETIARLRRGSSRRSNVTNTTTSGASSNPDRSPKAGKARSLAYHFTVLLAGFLAVVLSGYVISNAASNVVDELGLSDVLGGVVILSIATTIPEKLVAVLSGYKGHMDIMLANTVGSNMFLLTLCLGIIWAATGGSYSGGDVKPAEIITMFASTVVLAVTVLLRGKLPRAVGVIMLMGYITFLVLEFTVIHKV